VGGWTHTSTIHHITTRACVDELNRAEEAAWPWLGERVSVHHEEMLRECAHALVDEGGVHAPRAPLHGVMLKRSKNRAGLLPSSKIGVSSHQ
jgi:hypothetical protein